MVEGSINSCPFVILTFSTKTQTKKKPNVSKIILVNMVWRRLFHGYMFTQQRAYYCWSEN